ncbi:MAG: argininosuccinate synthase [Spirochaetia bacterium]|nr:argininosuccinate synthase [Spirochaetota bacterium]MCX8095923.1 argininosuccinate synthase [Spirochaetota bacterium]MDW8112241.1 argininosuccinate synthase [Spirochaetia bacterium]
MKIVLAYSGGLDTSVILKYLIERYNADVIAFVANLGQNEDLEEIKNKALKTGASKVYVEDLRSEFVEEVVWKVLKAEARYENYLLGTSMARPIIAKKQVEIAIKESAQAVAHGATGKGNDQVRFELAYKALAPELNIISPWKDDDFLKRFKGRSDMIKYAQENGIPVDVTLKKPYSMDPNLVHISYEGGILEDPSRPYDEEMFKMTKSPEEAPDHPEEVEIEFQNGVPISVNGQRLESYQIIDKLNDIGGRNGIGRIDIVENRLVGIKSRGVYETPGFTILMNAHNILSQLVWDRDVVSMKEMLSVRYGEIVYYGKWFHPLRYALDNFFDEINKFVSGKVRLKLYKGNITPISRESKYSIYDPEVSSFEGVELYNHTDAKGFINLYGLPTKMMSIKSIISRLS